MPTGATATRSADPQRAGCAVAATSGWKAQVLSTSSLSGFFLVLVVLPDEGVPEPPLGLAELVDPPVDVVSFNAAFTRWRISGKSGSGLEKPSTPCLKTMLRTLPS